jgi:hypothetical protein
MSFESIGTGELISEMLEMIKELMSRNVNEFDEIDIQRLLHIIENTTSLLMRIHTSKKT